MWWGTYIKYFVKTGCKNVWLGASIDTNQFHQAITLLNINFQNCKNLYNKAIDTNFKKITENFTTFVGEGRSIAT